MSDRSVFRTGPTDYLNQPAFFGEEVSVARYDEQTIPFYEKLTTRQLSVFWRPEEVDLSKDRIDFRQMPDHEKHIFVSNLKYQTLLDSIQGRSPALAFLPIVSIPEMETWIATWNFQETIHSRSYTHIKRNVMTSAEMREAFEDITLNESIAKRAALYTDLYDRLIALTREYHYLGEGTHIVNDEEVVVSMRELKKAFLRSWVATNALEAIAFYVSFACGFSFAEQDKMEGNAKILKMIAR